MSRNGLKNRNSITDPMTSARISPAKVLGARRNARNGRPGFYQHRRSDVSLAGHRPLGSGVSLRGASWDRINSVWMISNAHTGTAAPRPAAIGNSTDSVKVRSKKTLAVLGSGGWSSSGRFALSHFLGVSRSTTFAKGVLSSRDRVYDFGS